MVRNVPGKNTRPPPIERADGTIDARAERLHGRRVADDLRNDVALISDTTPDIRDHHSFVGNGDPRQAVSHGMRYVPRLVNFEIVADTDDVLTLHQWKDADNRRVYIKTNAPKGAKIMLYFHPRE